MVTFITAFSKCLTKVSVGEKGLCFKNRWSLAYRERHSGKRMGKLVTPDQQSKSREQMGNEVELTTSKPPPVTPQGSPA